MLYHRVSKYINEEKLFTPADKVLVALSGGADSVALLRIFVQLGYTCEAAHCNFHLRNEESVRDENFVRHLCRELDIPLHVIHFDTKAYAGEHHISIEMAARELRYNWFEEIKVETNSSVIAIAHHRDDSVETFLLNLIRGTGINGLCGIRVKNGIIVRPLLCVSREEILSYLNEINQEYVTDSTNLQDEYTRNKIRLNIITEMETINPSVKESIATVASRLSEVAHIYNKAIEEGKLRVMDKQGIQINALLMEPAPKSLLFEILNPLGFNSARIEDVFGSLSGQPGKVFSSNGWQVLKDRTHLLIRKSDSLPLAVDQVVELPEEGFVFLDEERKIHLERCRYTSAFVIPREKNVVCIDADKVRMPLVLRKWQAGDSFVPFGMKGKKKVSDYLTDRKLSLYDKEHTYVVCSANDILWIVGERSDNRFRIDSNTQEIILLKVLPR